MTRRHRRRRRAFIFVTANLPERVGKTRLDSRKWFPSGRGDGLPAHLLANFTVMPEVSSTRCHSPLMLSKCEGFDGVNA